MLHRELPYDGIAPYQVVIGVATKGLRPPIGAHVPKPFADMMKACWDEEPNVRPSFVLLTETLEKMSCPEPRWKKPRRKKAANARPEEESGILSPENFLSDEEKALIINNDDIDNEEIELNDDSDPSAGEEDKLLS